MANGSSDPPTSRHGTRKNDERHTEIPHRHCCWCALIRSRWARQLRLQHAKHPHSGVHCRDVYFGNRAVFGNTLHFYPTTSLRRSYCRTGSCLTTYNLRANTIYSPVILYDSFGRPYFVNQTNYPTLLR